MDLLLVEVEKVVIVPVEIVVGIVKADKGFSEVDVSIASAAYVTGYSLWGFFFTHQKGDIRYMNTGISFSPVDRFIKEREM